MSDPTAPIRVALVHDYLTQRGGAERVVLSMLRAFPGAPLYTSLYLPESTFPEFKGANVRVMKINQFGLLRRHHRLALPLLASGFSDLTVDADVAICSSSGWAHGARVTGRKIVYCHTPARWLYQRDRYLGRKHALVRLAVSVLAPNLARWDRRAAATAQRYVTQSTSVRSRIRDIYSIEAELLPAPHRLEVDGHRRPVRRLSPGFVLLVARLLPYKNVDVVIEAFKDLPGRRLAIVGVGPDAARLRRTSPGNIQFLGAVSDDELRWLYANCIGLVCASHEDYGLTPLEAAAFGKPSAVLRWGGFLDTVVDGETGIFFDRPEPGPIRAAIERLLATPFRTDLLEAHAARYSESNFVERLREMVSEEAKRVGVEWVGRSSHVASGFQ